MGSLSASLILRRAWPCALILASMALRNSPAQETPDSRAAGKPLPKEARYVATKGIPKKIILESSADSPTAVVEFLVRDFPRNGDISVLQSIPNDRSKAYLTYTGRRNTAATSDSFTFSARYPGGLYAKPAKVEIDLKELEPFIKAPARIEFGEVMVGKSVEKELFVHNSGNAPYQQKISLSPPWFLVEPESGDLALSPGGGQQLKIRYTPDAPGPAETELVFNPNPGGSSFLEGSGFNPFTLKTPRLILRWEPKSRTRLGQISIESHSPDILPVKLRPGPRLKISGGDSQFLEPGKTADLRLYLPSSDAVAFEEQLEIAFGSFTETVHVAALAPPAHFVLGPDDQPNGSLDFGPVVAGKMAMQSFQLKNIGGSSGEVRFLVNPPFSVMTPPGTVSLGAGHAEAYAVRLAAPDSFSGPFQGELTIEADNGQTLKLQMTAAVSPAGNPITQGQGMAGLPTALGSGSQKLPPAFPPAAPPGAGQAPDTPPDSTRRVPEADRLPMEQLEALRSPLGFITLPTVERDISENIPAVDAKTLQLEEEGRQQLAVSWPLSRDDLTDFEIEMRMNRLNTATSILESVWVPHYDVGYRQSGNRIIARIRGLSPNRKYEFRLFTLGNAGKVSPPAFFVVMTRMPLDWTWIYVGFGIVLLSSVSWFFWKRASAQLTSLE